MTDTIKIHRQPNPGPQTEALKRTEFEILYGGARGGGKTDAGLAWLLYDIDHPKFRGLVVRKNAEDLSDWKDRATQMNGPLGGVVTGNPGVIKFPSGATIRLGHLKDDNAYTKYQGHEYHRILIEELTHISTEENYLKLISSCRSTVPELFAQVFATTNPGGIGHSWVKKRFVDVALAGQPYTDPITTRQRIFIPARVEDNPVLVKNDPMYVKMLEGLPDDLRKAWREGSWDVFETKGSFYAQYIRAAREQQRIMKGLYDEHLDIYGFWDIGIADNTVGIIVQFFGKEVRIIDCIRGQDVGLDHYVMVMKEKGYDKGIHYFPPDIQVREQTNKGRTRKEYLESMGIHVEVTPKTGIDDGITLVRNIFNFMWFEQSTTEKLIEALNVYRKKWDDKNLIFGDPVHDWASNFADALRYLAVNYQAITGRRLIATSKPKNVESDPVLRSTRNNRGNFTRNTSSNDHFDSRV